MSKYILILFSFLFILSCKTQDKRSTSTQSTDSKIIFSLKSTSCMGECPEYEIKIKADSTIHFEGKKFTAVVGKASKTLSLEEHMRIMAMINEVAWSKLEDKYVSQMSDLPSYTFVYKGKSVYQYGSKPESLIKLRKGLLPIIDSKDFF